jgi:hypothetical protein
LERGDKGYKSNKGKRKGAEEERHEEHDFPLIFNGLFQ